MRKEFVSDEDIQEASCYIPDLLEATFPWMGYYIIVQGGYWVFESVFESCVEAEIWRNQNENQDDTKGT